MDAEKIILFRNLTFLIHSYKYFFQVSFVRTLYENHHFTDAIKKIRYSNIVFTSIILNRLYSCVHRCKFLSVYSLFKCTLENIRRKKKFFLLIYKCFSTAIAYIFASCIFLKRDVNHFNY